MIALLSQIADFLVNGLYDFVVETVSYWIQVSVKASLYLSYQTMIFSWDVAKDIISDLNITQTIDAAWSSLGAESLNTANFFKLPQAVANIVTAYITKFVFKFIGGAALL